MSKFVEEPKSRALKIIDALPGNTYLSKTGLLTLGVGLTTFVISKEIYIINEETLVLASFSGIIYSMLNALRGPYNTWAEEQIQVNCSYCVDLDNDYYGCRKCTTF